MSIKYEGAGLMLDINRIVRSLLWERFRSGEALFIPANVVLTKPWENLDLTSSWDEERKGWYINIRDRSEIAAKVEVIHEPKALPSGENPS